MALKKSVGGRLPPHPVAIWAVDLAADLRLQHQAAAAIGALQRRTRLSVRPVYLGSPSPLAESQSLAQARAQSRIDELTVAAGLSKTALLPIEVVDSDRSVNGRVSALLSFAREREAELIILSTRAHRGPVRWFLGSFADSMSLQSEIPLFIVNPSWKETPDFDEIIFPTDFSRRARGAFAKVLRFAALGAFKVCVFHKYGSDIGPSWDFNLVPSPTLSGVGNEELAEIRRELEKWRQRGEEAGVHTSVELDADSGTVVESILRRAEASRCIIAMTARSTRLEAIMLGSITRQMIREASAPIWVLCEPLAPQATRLSA